MVNSQVVWVSGANGTVLRTLDGGQNWVNLSIAEAAGKDLRDVEAFSPKEAFAMSAGPGTASGVFQTVDGGLTWTKVLDNPDPQGFFDAMAFWNRKRGLVMGDPVGGHITLWKTLDGGKTWKRLALPPALAGEGGFAASGTCLIVRGTNEVLLGTGGKGAARLFRSTDGGSTWQVFPTPLRNDGPAAGIFGLASNARFVVAVGGAYDKPAEDLGTAALSMDAGTAWKTISGIGGYRSGIAILPGNDRMVAVGSHGTSYSLDGGNSWHAEPRDGFHAVQFTRKGIGWAAGANGKIARIVWND